MTTEIYENEEYKSLCTSSPGYALADYELTTRIKPTQAAIEFYKEQAKGKQRQDEAEKENKQFKESVHNHTSYTSEYTGDLDLSTTIWNDRCKEYPYLEKYCIHGINCKRINNCGCSHNSNKGEYRKRRKKEVTRY